MTLRTLLAAALVAGSLGASRAQAQITMAVGGGPLPNLFTNTIAPMFEKATGKKLNVVTKNGQALAVDGKAEIAVQQVAELLAVPGLDLLGGLPGDLQKYLPSSAGIPAKAKEAETAKALITFLRSAPVKTVLKEKGFDVP